MKVISLVCIVSALGLWAWLALGSPAPLRGSPPNEWRSGVRAGTHPEGRLASVRAWADADSATTTGSDARTYGRTRIGPQPWPDDLPPDWPALEPARVLADTWRDPGDRLLLVDWPERPAHAVDSLRHALEARGYRVVEPRTRGPRHALHALSDDAEVVLTFFARDASSRVEILFLAPATG